MVDCFPPSSSDGLGCAGREETRHSEWLCSRRGPCMSAGVVSRVEPAGVVRGLHGNNESALHDMEPHRRSRTSIVHPLSHICTPLSHNVHSIVTPSAHHWKRGGIHRSSWCEWPRWVGNARRRGATPASVEYLGYAPIVTHLHTIVTHFHTFVTQLSHNCHTFLADSSPSHCAVLC